MIYSYPSYLGVPVFKENKRYLPLNVLGMTNGREIKIQNNLPKDVAAFVLFHEEEHVKDMFATEREVDERALRRFVAKNSIITKNVKRLMRRRHGIGSSEKHFLEKQSFSGSQRSIASLQISLNKKKEEKKTDNFISYLYSDFNPSW